MTCTRHVPGYGPCGLPEEAHSLHKTNHAYEAYEVTEEEQDLLTRAAQSPTVRRQREKK